MKTFVIVAASAAGASLLALLLVCVTVLSRTIHTPSAPKEPLIDQIYEEYQDNPKRFISRHKNERMRFRLLTKDIGFSHDETAGILSALDFKVILGVPKENIPQFDGIPPDIDITVETLFEGVIPPDGVRRFEDVLVFKQLHRVR